MLRGVAWRIRRVRFASAVPARTTAGIPGVTLVACRESARHAVAALSRLRDRCVAWDTETEDLDVRAAERPNTARGCAG